MSQDAPHEAVEQPAVDPAPATTSAEADDEHVSWGVASWYVLLCALPLAGAFFLPVPLMMVMRSYRPPVDFTTAAWAGVIVGWVLWAFAVLAWLIGNALFRDESTAFGGARWWRRSTQLWIGLVLVWGLVSTVGIWVFYAVVGHALGLDGIN